MTDPRMLEALLLVPENDCARCVPRGLIEGFVSAGLTFLLVVAVVVVLLRCREGRDVGLVALEMTDFELCLEVCCEGLLVTVIIMSW